MDKGDLGTLAGALAAGTLATTGGLGAVGIIVSSAVGGYIGHNLAEPHHYSPKYSYK